MGLLKATSIICLLGLLVRWVPNASAKVCQVFTTKGFFLSPYLTRFLSSLLQNHPMEKGKLPLFYKEIKTSKATFDNG